MEMKVVLLFVLTTLMNVVLGEYILTQSKEKVYSGSSVTLICNTTTTVSAINWVRERKSYTATQDSGTSCSGNVPSQYIVSCNGGIIFDLTINNINFSENGVAWTCQGEYGGISSNILYIPIYVNLTNVSITTRPAEIEPNILTLMNCSTNPCYPPARITWTLNGIKLEDGITNSTETVADYGIITRSSLNTAFTAEDKGKRLVCSANDVSTFFILPIRALSTSSSSSVSSNTPTTANGTASQDNDLTNTFIAVGVCAGILVCGITAAVCFCRKSKVCCFRKSVDKKKTSRDDSAVNETTRPGSDVSYNSGFADTGPNYDNPSPAVLEATGLPDTNTSRVTQNFSHNPLADNQPPVRGSYKSEDNKYVFYSGSRNVDTNDVNGPGNNRFGGSDYYNQSKKDSRPIDRNIQMSRLERSHNTRI